MVTIGLAAKLAAPALWFSSKHAYFVSEIEAYCSCIARHYNDPVTHHKRASRINAVDKKSRTNRSIMMTYLVLSAGFIID